MKNNMNKNNKFGFTLVELLAVIVILAIILVIAVPKIMSVIEDAKKATLESTAKMIASAAEKVKVQNSVLGKEEVITCKNVAKINDVDYDGCSIDFDNNGKALVTIIGSGKFEGFNVCKGTKTSSIAVDESCSLVTFTVNLNGGNPNKTYEEKYEAGVSVELETPTKEGYKFKEWKVLSGENASINGSTLTIGTTNTEVEAIYDGKEYTITYELDGGIIDENAPTRSNAGDIVTIPNSSKEGWTFTGWSVSGKNAVINDNKLTIGVENIILTANYEVKFTEYIANLLVKESELNNGLINPKVTYDGKEYDTGIRYSGSMDEVKNKVYYNCEDKDVNDISYGEENYNYANSCEIWRIIGVFDTKTSTGGNTVSRVKLINTVSSFTASWDSSASTVNSGYGINQWGKSTYEDGTTYEGADLMRLLNGYYIGEEGATCKYCTGEGQVTCNEICTEAELRDKNMKILTSTAKSLIENAVWDTYAVKWSTTEIRDSRFASTAYLQEKGLSTQHTGKICEGTTYENGIYCTDTVNRITNWIGLIGLMSISDVSYADGWLYNPSGTTVYPRAISPRADGAFASYECFGSSGEVDGGRAHHQNGVFPTVYLKSNIKITGGNGGDEPYKLAM